MDLTVQITDCPVNEPRSYSKRAIICSKKKRLKASMHFIAYPQLPFILINCLTLRIALLFVFSMDESYLFYHIIISYHKKLQGIKFIKYKAMKQSKKFIIKMKIKYFLSVVLLISPEPTIILWSLK